MTLVRLYDKDGNRIPAVPPGAVCLLGDDALWQIVERRRGRSARDARGHISLVAQLAFDVAAVVRAHYEMEKEDRQTTETSLRDQIARLRGDTPRSPFLDRFA